MTRISCRLISLITFFAASMFAPVPGETLRLSETGQEAIPASMALLLEHESALEAAGDTYGARRLLNECCSGAHDIEALKREAFLDDAYGAFSPDAYASLLDLMVKNEAPQLDVVELCRRGLIASLRDEQFEKARIFADKLKSTGDFSGQDLLQPRNAGSAATVELPGGVEAFNFLIFGGGKNTPDRILVDYAHMLTSIAPEMHTSVQPKNWETITARIHEYFRIIAELTAMGERKGNRVVIELTNANKPGKQRTEKVFNILGLELKSGKQGLEVKSAEGKAEARKQDTLAALAIDDAALQDALAAGKTYELEIAFDKIPVFPNGDFWQNVIGEKSHFAGGLAEGLLADPRAGRLFSALNSMDRSTASALARSISIGNLEDRYAVALSYYSAALAIHGNRAEVPGGIQASATWERLTGVSPNAPIPFFESLLNRDDGRLIAFFYSLSQLDPQHQRFFTRSPERLRRFYELFRDSPDMKRGGEHRASSGTFTEFMRELPLNDDLTVDFPGAAEVWMVAKGKRATASSLQGLALKMKKAVAPDSEDEILVRLASSSYGTQGGHLSELTNFVAVAHIDAARNEPMTPEAALLLAQGYSTYGGLYSYFAELGDLEAADYQKLFSLSDQMATMNVAFQNVGLGQINAFLAVLGVLHERGAVPEKDLLGVYRTGIGRYLEADNPAAWADASLKNIDDLTRAADIKTTSHDQAMLELMLGSAANEVHKKHFNQVLAMQKAPSLDRLFAIAANLDKVSQKPALLDDVQRQLGSFAVLIPLKAWKLEGQHRKCLDQYDTAQPLALVAKIREKQSKHKPNRVEIEELCDELLGELNPWIELAMVSRVYARNLDPSDLVVSEDPMLIRKHEFVTLDSHGGFRPMFSASHLAVESGGEGSYFSGGLADFSVSAGHARAAGNHLNNNEAFATAIVSSIRATEWSSLTGAQLEAFGATVRLAREWIVRSAVSEPARTTLEAETLGLLSLNRRHSLLDGLEQRDWTTVWNSVSVSDLFFLGQGLIQNAATNKELQEIWSAPEVSAMRRAAAGVKDLDVLGSVAPSLNGCAKPRLVRYAPYEEYEHLYMPEPMAERTAELKLYLAWIADNRAWPPALLESISNAAADKFLGSIRMRDLYDWRAVVEAYKKLSAENLELSAQQP